MSLRESVIGFMHNRAIAANTAQIQWAGEQSENDETSAIHSFATRIAQGLHWLRVNITEGLEEIVTPDNQLQSLLDSRKPTNTIGADE